jgi:dTDP-4-amino-4,6-dideoxygalactose transaminase
MYINNHSSELAIHGGTPVRSKPWPQWPLGNNNIELILQEVLYSGRWAISGMYNSKKTYDKQFSEAFASYHNVPYCVLTSNGSSALSISLEAIGVGYGDEVIIPGLTWVACASAILRIGAIPILVDVEPDTLCISVEDTKQAITSRTACIMLVHLACTVADLDSFMKLSEDTGIPIIEDCSQAHGSIWGGQRVGTFGKAGAFSMQNEKVLTCGEGGAIITSDPKLYDSLQQLRTDGRRYSKILPPIGEIELENVGSIQGYNYCLSEFQAAILFERLRNLDKENTIRERNGEYLRSLLLEVGGITPLARHPKIDNLTFYQFCIHFNLQDFHNADIETIRLAISAELGISLTKIGAPLNDNLLYTPFNSNRTGYTEEMKKLINPKRFNLPVAAQASKECLKIHHRVLLGNKSDIEDIASVFEKVKRNSKKL